MTKPLRLEPEAADELVEATRWYEAESPGAGARFLAAVQHVFDQVAAHPALGAKTKGKHGARRLPVTRFPYSVVYLDLPDRVHVIAVAHAKRRPGYWRHRGSRT